MIDFMQLFTKEIRQVIPESYHEINRKETVIYPYATFDFDTEPMEDGEGWYIDIDIFDYNTSYGRVLQAESDLKKFFRGRRRLTEGLFVRYEFQGSNRIDSTNDLIKRRNVRFYCKIEWRKQ